MDIVEHAKDCKDLLWQDSEYLVFNVNNHFTNQFRENGHVPSQKLTDALSRLYHTRDAHLKAITELIEELKNDQR
jgi:hypothetical protein